MRVNTDACHGDTRTVGVSGRHRLLCAGTAGLGPRSFCWANGWESCKPASVESSTPGSVAVVLALPSLEHKRPHFRLDISQEADCQQASVSQRKENSVVLSRLIRSSLKFLRAPVADVPSFFVFLKIE